VSAQGTPGWHGLPGSEALRLLESDLENGLADAEARRRLAKFGPNRVARRPPAPVWKLFLLQLHQPLIYILIAAGAVTAWLGQWVDSSVIFGVVVINAIVGCLQEERAGRSIAALAHMVVTEATVRRGGRRQRVPSEDLVPGDVVLLESGGKVPADLRLLSVRNLQIDESALTGESAPVEKHAEPVAPDTVLADRRNLAYAGTLVSTGRAEGVVWATGDRTEMGRIAWLVAEAVDVSTPLTRKIAQFSGVVLWGILALAALTFGIGLWRGENPVEMLMASVALAVAAIPEGLPAAVTITLAIGVARMARRRAIIRNLPAVETLGSTTVICSDKTGTLTENQMTVREIYAGGKMFEVTGGGYEPRGEILDQRAPADPARHGALAECLRAGLLCNDSQLVREQNRWAVQGDPTEAALIVAAEKAGLAHADVVALQPRLDAIPFESEHQFMATLHGGGPRRERVIYKKGAVERLLERCPVMLADTGDAVPLDAAAVHDAAEAMAAKGLRVLAFARRMAPDDQRTLGHEHVAAGLTFLGLQGMIDPPRPEAIEAVRRCQRAGIAVKMVTGDHLMTAVAVARQVGIGGAGGGFALTGRELDRISDEQLPELAERAAVFARVAPEQKLRLVRALQSRGHVVAMTGDGVNDAPALKQADIGAAMGISGTEVARGAADMILTDDNFATIEAAVEEGRNVFDNLAKFIVWTLPTNLGEGLLMLTAIVLGAALPALPVQVLYVNMASALLLGLMLVFEPKERDLMERPPRDPRAPILTATLLLRTALVAVIMQAGAFFLFTWEQQAHGATLAQARTVVVNVIVMVEVFYLFNCRSLTRSMFSVGVFSNPWVIHGVAGMIGLQLVFTYAPPAQALFHSASIDAGAWLRILAVALAAYAVVGLEKWLRTRIGAGRAHEPALEPLPHRS